MKSFLYVSLPLFLLDQVTKLLILANFDDPRETGYTDSRPVIEGFFEIVRVHNTGVAFGRFNGGAFSNMIFSVIAAIALVAIVVLWRKGTFHNLPSRVAAILLVPGILGNLTDRLWHGYVVDFLHFDLGFMIWPSFNVADACISVAACLLFVSAFLHPKDEGKKEAATES